ncbi:MAG: hypothetical protein ACREJ3_17645, partial [Polyangiaceae bacterium]
MHEIRLLTVQDIAPAGALLGRAFADNPCYQAILSHRSGEARAAAVARVKTGFTSASVRGEEAHGLWVDGRLA